MQLDLQTFESALVEQHTDVMQAARMIYFYNIILYKIWN